MTYQHTAQIALSNMEQAQKNQMNNFTLVSQKCNAKTLRFNVTNKERKLNRLTDTGLRKDFNNADLEKDSVFYSNESPEPKMRVKPCEYNEYIKEFPE